MQAEIQGCGWTLKSDIVRSVWRWGHGAMKTWKEQWKRQVQDKTLTKRMRDSLGTSHRFGAHRHCLKKSAARWVAELLLLSGRPGMVEEEEAWKRAAACKRDRGNNLGRKIKRRPHRRILCSRNWAHGRGKRLQKGGFSGDQSGHDGRQRLLHGEKGEFWIKTFLTVFKTCYKQSLCFFFLMKNSMDPQKVALARISRPAKNKVGDGRDWPCGWCFPAAVCHLGCSASPLHSGPSRSPTLWQSCRLLEPLPAQKGSKPEANPQKVNTEERMLSTTETVTAVFRGAWADFESAPSMCQCFRVWKRPLKGWDWFRRTSKIGWIICEQSCFFRGGVFETSPTFM